MTPTSDRLLAQVTDVLQQAPEWVRRDLTARDHATRARAEETLAAIIAAALDADRRA